MQTSAVAVLAAVALVAHQASAAIPPFVMKCMEETGVTGADALKFAETGDATDGMKCNMKCIMLAAGVMTEDGKLVVEPMLAHTPESVHPIITECAQIEASADLCDVAYRHNKCIRDKIPDFYLEKMKKAGA